MKTLEQLKEIPRLLITQSNETGGCGLIYLNGTNKPPLTVIFSYAVDGYEWEHVSVSYSNRCPTWDEMCRVKDMFFYDTECVIQFHPAKKDYVNIYPYCLHLWKKATSEFELPPKECV
jgi:hypothetical protein